MNDDVGDKVNEVLTSVQKLERITAFAEEQGINVYEICNIYGRYKAMDNVSGMNLAFKRTMLWIYEHS